MDVVERWTRHLRATGRRPNTIAGYRSDVDRLRAFGGVADLCSLTPVDVRAFLASERELGLRDATLIRRFRSIRQFYGWLDRRHEIVVDPTGDLAAPRADRPPDVVGPRELAALLGACSDERTHRRPRVAGVFEARRDTAMVELFLTTGVTAQEMIRLGVAAIDLDDCTVTVVGRNGESRAVPVLRHVSEVLAKYLAVREAHSVAGSTSSLWLGERGALTRSGMSQMLVRRSARAGIRPVTPADFRRTFAFDALGRGDDPSVVAALGGWGSPAQLEAYQPRSWSTEPRVVTRSRRPDR